VYGEAELSVALFLSSDTYIAIDVPIYASESKEDTTEGSGDMFRYEGKACERPGSV